MMTDKLRRETDYERVTRDARLKNVVAMAVVLLTAAAAWPLWVPAEWYR